MALSSHFIRFKQRKNNAISQDVDKLSLINVYDYKDVKNMNFLTK